MEDKFEVPFLSNSSYYNSYDNLYDNELDDNSSLIRKLFLKCQKLLLKKKVYKQKFSKLSKSFGDMKLEFSNVSSLNEKLTLDLKASTSLKVSLIKLRKKMQFFWKRF